DFIVVCGSFLRSDSPNLSYKVNQALKMNKASGIYFHPLDDKVVKNYSKNFICIKHENEFDIGILFWILQTYGENLPNWLNEKLKNGEFAKFLGLDKAKIAEISANKDKFSLIIGEDFIFSKNAPILAKLTGLIQKFTKFKVLIIPPRTNSLGVSLICDLDTAQKGEILGYNEKGDISMGCFKSDLDMPSLIEQEGTFTNYDKCVVPTNAATEYDGFELNDIANALGIKSKFTIDYTPNLGENFKNIKFVDLENFYDNGGVSHRGYELETKVFEACLDEFDIKNLNVKQKLAKDEILIYKANPIHQFSKFSNAASQLNEVATLQVGSEFLDKFGVEDGEVVTIKKDEFSFAIAVKLNKNISGVCLPFFDDKVKFEKIFTNSRYAVVSVEISTKENSWATQLF
ncbi:MAG: NADH-quinone oxidoreductase subunit G, partial [Campylobacter sp.]|nr:NADH-quinone oxidoreductase subunit G [Campylobacter sp.]